MSQKNEFEKHVDKWMKKFTGLIDGLELKIEKEREDLDETEKVEIRKKINDLKATRIAISQNLLELRKANDRDWPAINERIEKRISQIDEEFRESLAYFQ